MQISGKSAIVSGGGTGIGKKVALELSRLNVSVLICGRRKEKLIEVEEQINDEGGIIKYFVGDISIISDVKQLVDYSIDEFGKIDILINNAGVPGGDYIHLQESEDWDTVFDINLKGQFLLAKEVLQWMRKQKSGHIINISSEAGIRIYKGYGAYGIAKRALIELSEYIQEENQDYGIRVNSICPGMVVTEMTEDLSNLDHDKSLYPEDISDLIIWLLTRRPNIKIGTPILIQTMQNPWKME